MLRLKINSLIRNELDKQFSQFDFNFLLSKPYYTIEGLIGEVIQGTNNLGESWRLYVSCVIPDCRERGQTHPRFLTHPNVLSNPNLTTTV